MDDAVETVWLGDLAGFEVVPVVPDDGASVHLELRHRCGWSQRLPFEGITGDGGAYLANIVERAVVERQGHHCAHHEH